jgi:hypothetical protein
MSRAQTLAKELGQPKLWVGRQLAVAPAISTGFSSLDAVLPGRGWPLGAVTELIPQTEGIGELSLLMPVLLHLQKTGQRIADHELRRLQLAAETGQALGFLYRPSSALRNSSPAAVRLSLQAAAAGLRIELIKARGGHQGASVLCAMRRPGMPQLGKTTMPPPVSRYSPPALRALA